MREERLSGLDRPSLEMVIFGGKGGVGKTSCALASALWFSERWRTVVVSTDPAHSLADSLGCPVGPEPVGVPGVPGLSALEVSADRAFRLFKERHEAELVKLFETSSELDQEDIREMMSLSIPGIDEMMSLKAVIDLVSAGAYERYVIDTAPTGHALRLISSPELLDGWVRMASKMRWKYRYMVESFSGEYEPDGADNLLMDLKRTVRRLESLLTDPGRCEFIPVCIPEAMAVRESARLIEELAGHGIFPTQMVMNNVMGEDEDGSGFCRRRRESQAVQLALAEELFGGLRIATVPEFPEEVRGLGGLGKVRNALFGPHAQH